MENRAAAFDIELLADHPALVPVLVEWFEREWAPWYGAGGRGDARADLEQCSNRDALPLALVALHEGAPCGTAALKTESVSTHPHLSPWLAALLVAPAYRRRGVGEALIAAVEARARGLGFDRLYVGTGKGSGTPEATLARRGWQFLETGPYLVGDVSIFSKPL